ncbi:flagellar basal body-associated FliL family protein [Chitinibacteraceae bacterium HSL-7]
MAEAKAEQAAPKKSKKTLIIVLVVVILLLVLLVAVGVVGFLLLRSQSADQYAAPPAAAAEHSTSHDEEPKKKKKKKDEGESHPPVYEKLQTITANLNDPAGESVVQTEVVLELVDAEVGNQLKAMLPKVQAETIKIIRSKSPEQVRSVEGTNALGEEIRAKLNELLDLGPDEGVLSVNFTTFIMQ